MLRIIRHDRLFRLQLSEVSWIRRCGQDRALRIFLGGELIELGTLKGGTILRKKPNTDPLDAQKDRRHSRDGLKGLLKIPIINFGTFCQFR